MAQAIRNIKKGQRFIVLSNEKSHGFEVGCIVEAIENIDDCSENECVYSKWIGGCKHSYVDNISTIRLVNTVSELKRFKGKIK